MAKTAIYPNIILWPQYYKAVFSFHFFYLAKLFLLSNIYNKIGGKFTLNTSEAGVGPLSSPATSPESIRIKLGFSLAFSEDIEAIYGTKH
jgi:hypothetical protein